MNGPQEQVNHWFQSTALMQSQFQETATTQRADSAVRVREEPSEIFCQLFCRAAILADPFLMLVYFGLYLILFANNSEQSLEP